MPRKVITRTGKAGTLANDRRILAGVAAPTAAPTVQADGFLLDRNEFIHLLFKVGGTAPVFSVQVWWWSSISQTWHKGEVLTVNANDVVTIEVQGLERLYLEVAGVAGVLPTLDAWLAHVVPV